MKKIHGSADSLAGVQLAMGGEPDGKRRNRDVFEDAAQVGLAHGKDLRRDADSGRRPA